MSVPLVLALPLIEGETPASYVARNARRHALAPRDFCSTLGMRWPFLCSGHPDQIERLAGLTGQGRDWLQRWSAEKIGIGRYRVGKTLATTAAFRRTATRVCPLCVQEALAETGSHGVFQLLEWSVLCLHRCDKHGCGLVDLPRARHARETYDIVSQVLRHRDALKNAWKACDKLIETSFETYIRDRIWNGPRRDWLERFDLTQLYRSSLSLGAALEGVDAGTLSQLPVAADRELTQIGFEYLEAGPESFVGALERLRVQSTSERPYFSADLGPFYHWLREVHDDPALGNMTSLTRRHIFNRYPVPEDKMVFGEYPPRELLLTMEEARKRSGFGAVFLKKLLGHMAGVSEEEALKRTDVSVSELAEVMRYWKGLMNLTEAADTLGIRPDQVKSLAGLGVLTTVRITSALRYLKREEVGALATGVLQLPTSSKGQGRLPLRQFCRLKGIPLAKVVSAWANGELEGKVWRGEGAGLLALEIDVEAMKGKREVALTRDLTLPETASYLMISIIAVRKLRDAGLLVQTQKTNPDTNHRKNYIARQSIRRFERRYMTLGQMAEQRMVAPIHLARQLDRDGIMPIGCAGGQVRVYEKAEV